MCDGKPCRSNGPPYWVTQEFLAATNRSTPLDAVVIMLGTNDAKSRNWEVLGNASQYEQDTRAMVQLFQGLPRQPQVFLASPPPLYHSVYSMNQSVVGKIIPGILRGVAEETNSTFVDLVQALGGWPSLDKPALFLPNATNGGCDILAKCKGDGCHPDDLGHRAIAEVIAAALVKSSRHTSTIV